MRNLPLVYSCSGCSNVAQLANQAALALAKQGHAEMSCIAGVGGGVKSLVKRAQSGRTVIALDGCQLQCTRHCLQRADVEPTLHIILTDHGFNKKKYSDPEALQVSEICHAVNGALEKVRRTRGENDR